MWNNVDSYYWDSYLARGFDVRATVVITDPGFCWSNFGLSAYRKLTKGTMARKVELLCWITYCWASIHQALRRLTAKSRDVSKPRDCVLSSKRFFLPLTLIVVFSISQINAQESHLLQSLSLIQNDCHDKYCQLLDPHMPYTDAHNDNPRQYICILQHRGGWLKEKAWHWLT